MEDDAGLVLRENFVNSGAFLNAADFGIEGYVGETPLHFTVDFEEWRLSDFESDDPARTKSGDLTAEFRANGASSAGDHHHPVRDGVANLLFFEAHRSSSEQVLDRNFPDLAGKAMAFDDLSESRHGLALHVGRMTELEDPGHLEAGGSWNCYEDDFDLVFLDK